MSPPASQFQQDRLNGIVGREVSIASTLALSFTAVVAPLTATGAVVAARTVVRVIVIAFAGLNGLAATAAGAVLAFITVRLTREMPAP